MTVLLLGESLPEDHPLRGASAIRLVKADFNTAEVTVLSLPPYVWVRTPALASAGIASTALTLSYWEAMEAGTGSERARMAYASGVLLQTLEENFGLKADHYVTLKQGAFVDMIDALGGLSIDLPEAVDGWPSRLGYYSAGRQVLDGQATLDYVVIYPAVGDQAPTEWERLARQEQVLAALKAQLARPETMLKLPGAVSRFYQDVVTDLSLSQVLALGCLANEPDLSLAHVSLATDMVTQGPDKILYPKMDEIVAYLQAAFIE